ncbi:amino acid permease [Limosilactobacillus pulli]|uniref:amino acid permease n=1 Tax=Limosilactobacillus pulli TaxID=2991833 RepID=UPI0024B9755E|nr:amino acid permease [Limosilactobacillus pulli]
MTNSKVRDNQLSFAGLVAICVSAMIGSAIFDLPKNMATVAGATAQILAWITTGIGMWLTAEVFMILSAVKPDLTAGMYDYGVEGFGPFVGFLTAWGYFVSNCATNAAFAVLVMNTLNYFFPGTFAGGNNWPSMIGASLLTWGMMGLTLKGTKSSNRMQKIAMIFLMIVITVLIISLMGNFSWQKFTTDMQANVVMPSVHNLNLGSVSKQTLATMMVTLWMFSGIEGAAVMAGRAKKRSQVKNGYDGRISDLHYDRYFDQSAVAGGILICLVDTSGLAFNGCDSDQHLA